MQSRRKQALATQQATSPQAPKKAASSTTADPPPSKSEVENDSFEDDVDMSNDDAICRMDQDVALPRTTITNVITEKLPDDVRMSNASKDMLIQLSMSFISNLAAKANTICATHNKKTIVAEHVFEAMHEAKQTQLLAPIFGQANYGKLSYNKARDIAIKKVNECEQQNVKKFPQSEANNMTAEQLAAEQEKIFENARNFEIAKAGNNQLLDQDSSPAQQQVSDPFQEAQPTAIERMRAQIMSTDFCLDENDGAKGGATEDEDCFQFN